MLAICRGFYFFRQCKIKDCNNPGNFLAGVYNISQTVAIKILYFCDLIYYNIYMWASGGMADAYGSGPYGRKSLRVQLPSRPFLFWKISMRKYGYQRPSATLMVTRKRSARRQKPSFFFRFFCFLFIIICIGWGAFWGVRYVYRTVQNAQLTDWHVKSVSLSGLSGQREKEIFALATSYEGKPFTSLDADKLRSQLVKQYPMLTHISVSRGLLSGKLKIAAQPRRPVVQFLLPDHSHRYVDEDSVVYADPQEVQNILRVDLIGEVPDKLQPSFVELVQTVLKLKSSLAFESLQFNVDENTVTMRLPDRSLIRFGQAQHLKQKAQRACEIMKIAREKYKMPVTLNFAFFEKGKVFLTQTTH